MSSVPGHSKACCNTPAVVSTGYKHKGKYEELAGYKTYVTGSSDATKGLIASYDIFGLFEQTIQGCDILAEGDEKRKYKVFMPDWFKGEPLPLSIIPINTPEKEAQLSAFTGQKNPAAGAAAQLPRLVEAYKAAYPNIKSWGVVGYCWGGKVSNVAVTTLDPNPFAVCATLHPAEIEGINAAAVRVPFIMLVSGEDPADATHEVDRALKVPKHVEIFQDQVHGWMSARADLADAHVKEEYARGYKTLLEFFAQHWA